MIPVTYTAFFHLRKDAERCVADLGDEYLSLVEPHDFPGPCAGNIRIPAAWRLRAARPAADDHERGEHFNEVFYLVEHHCGEPAGARSELADEPLDRHALSGHETD